MLILSSKISQINFIKSITILYYETKEIFLQINLVVLRESRPWNRYHLNHYISLEFNLRVKIDIRIKFTTTIFDDSISNFRIGIESTFTIVYTTEICPPIMYLFFT